MAYISGPYDMTVMVVIKRRHSHPPNKNVYI